MVNYPIRVFGDPVLRRPAADVTDIDGTVADLVDTMFRTMYDAPGIGLAAPQVGVQRRFFVYDINDGTGPSVLINPRIVEATGEWEYEEGCLSLPGLAFELVRPKIVTVEALDLDGNPVTIEGDELLGRLFQHEIDHLDGVLMFDRIEDPDARRAVRKQLREQAMDGAAPRDRTHAL
jgi:peptide deformylase